MSMNSSSLMRSVTETGAEGGNNADADAAALAAEEMGDIGMIDIAAMGAGDEGLDTIDLDAIGTGDAGGGEEIDLNAF